MNRRRFLGATGMFAGATMLMDNAARLAYAAAAPPKQFKLAVISDGLSPDFETALKILKKYQVGWVEVRAVWGGYNTELSAEQIRKLKDLLGQYSIRLSMEDTALFKCTLPGTKPLGNPKDAYPYSGQMDLLKRGMDRAHDWGTDRVRIFTFWRVAEPEKIFGRISDEVHKAAEVAKASGIRLLIENESACNVATGRELGKMLATLPANVGANWDTGNGMRWGEAAYPDGYSHLDPKRIWNLHLKGSQCTPDFKTCKDTYTDEGQTDLKSQLRALLKAGYNETMSLECEWTAPGMTHAQTTERSLQGIIKVMNEAVA